MPSTPRVTLATPWALFSCVSLAVLGLYVLTLFPSLPGGDGGELITAAYLHGSPHPPGYPLFALLAKLVTLLPFGSVAWRVNLLTAACGAASAGMLAVAVARWSGNVWAGVAAAGLFAFSPGVWSLAVGAEVFTLNNLAAAGLLLVAVLYVETGRTRWAMTGAAIFGLGMANHHTLLFLGLPLAVMLVVREPTRWMAPGPLLKLTACFAAGLLPYLYLPIASLHPPEVTWGDQRTVAGFVTHLLRSEYGTLRLGGDSHASVTSFPNQVVLYTRFEIRELLYVGVPLAAVGLWTGWKERQWRPVLAWTVGAFLFYVVTFHLLANLPLSDPLFLHVQSRFWLMPSLLVCAWAGLGFAALAPHLRRTAMPMAIGLVGLQAGLHYRDRDQSGAREFLDYGTSLLRAMPRDALLLARGDLIVNTLQYAQQVEGIRRDVAVLDLERLSYPWMARVVASRLPGVTLPGDVLAPGRVGGYSLAELVQANADGRRVLLAGNLKPEEGDVSERYDRWPLGIAEVLVPHGRRMDTTSWLRESEAALPHMALPAVRHRRPGTWSRVVWHDYWEARHRRGVKMLEIGIALDDPDWTRRAAVVLVGVADGNAEGSPLVYRNLGLAYAQLWRRDGAYEPLMRRAWERYLVTGDSLDPQMAAIRNVLRQRPSPMPR